MKKSTNVFLILIIVVLLGVIGVGGYFLIKDKNDTNKQINDLKNEIANSEKNTENTLNTQAKNEVQPYSTATPTYNTSENTSITPSNSNENTSNTSSNVDTQSLSINGKYEFKDQTENYYHESSIEITNQNDTSINFSINTVHGRNVDNVNIGEINEKASKIEIPQEYVIPDSTQYAYQFVENKDGNTYEITIIYTAHKTFQYITIAENYSNGINPYAGHNVYFAGEYEKIQ